MACGHTGSRGENKLNARGKFNIGEKKKSAAGTTHIVDLGVWVNFSGLSIVSPCVGLFDDVLQQCWED